MGLWVATRWCCFASTSALGLENRASCSTGEVASDAAPAGCASPRAVGEMRASLIDSMI